MTLITPLILERCRHSVSSLPDNPETVNFAYQVLKTLMSKPESPYLLSPIIPNLLNYISRSWNISDNLLSQNIINELANTYQQHLKNLLTSYGVCSVDQISQDFIIYRYDQLITNLANRNILDENEKADIYKNVCNIISERDIALWAVTGKLQFIQADIIGSLYSIDPDLLIFHDDHKMKHLRDYLAHKWGDPMIINQWQYVLDKCNNILQILDYDKSVNKSEISIDKVSSNVEMAGESKVTLSEIESQSYWQIRWWILFAMFLSGDYDNVVLHFKDLLTCDKTNHKILKDSIQGLELLDSCVIDKKSLLRIVVISIILTQNNESREKLCSDPILIDTFFEDKLLQQFKKHFEDIKFPEVLENMKSLKSDISWCSQLDEIWNKVESLLIQKSLMTYLSFTNRVTLDGLSKAFTLDKNDIKNFIIRSISILDLPLFFDTHAEIIEYAPRKSSKYPQKFIQQVHNNVDEEVLRLKAAKLNRIINGVDNDVTQDKRVKR